MADQMQNHDEDHHISISAWCSRLDFSSRDTKRETIINNAVAAGEIDVVRTLLGQGFVPSQVSHEHILRDEMAEMRALLLPYVNWDWLQGAIYLAAKSNNQTLGFELASYLPDAAKSGLGGWESSLVEFSRDPNRMSFYRNLETWVKGQVPTALPETKEPSLASWPNPPQLLREMKTLNVQEVLDGQDRQNGNLPAELERAFSIIRSAISSENEDGRQWAVDLYKRSYQIPEYHGEGCDAFHRWYQYICTNSRADGFDLQEEETLDRARTICAVGTHLISAVPDMAWVAVYGGFVQGKRCPSDINVVTCARGDDITTASDYYVRARFREFHPDELGKVPPFDMMSKYDLVFSNRQVPTDPDASTFMQTLYAIHKFPWDDPSCQKMKRNIEPQMGTSDFCHYGYGIAGACVTAYRCLGGLADDIYGYPSYSFALSPLMLPYNTNATVKMLLRGPAFVFLPPGGPGQPPRVFFGVLFPEKTQETVKIGVL